MRDCAIEVPKNAFDSYPMNSSGTMHKLTNLIDRKCNIGTSESQVL
ncbi:unnamed protein product, partial [Prunus brigantina]